MRRAEAKSTSAGLVSEGAVSAQAQQRLCGQRATLISFIDFHDYHTDLHKYSSVI